MERNIEFAMVSLISMLAKQYARTRVPHHKYIDRVVFNFQPGMTARYLKYLLEHATSGSTFHENVATNLTEQQQQCYSHFLQNFDQVKQRISIINKTNVKSAVELLSEDEPRILILQCEGDPADDSNPFKPLIRQYARSNHSLIVFAEPLFGLRSYALEDTFNIKVRNVVLPRLVQPLKNHNQDCDYSFKPEDYTASYGVPALLESSSLDLSAEDRKVQLLNTMALWKKPENLRYIGYYSALFDHVYLEEELSPITKLRSSKLKVVDAAAILGFDVNLLSKGSASSECEEKPSEASQTSEDSSSNDRVSVKVLQVDNFTHSISAVDILRAEYEVDSQNFDFFTVIRADSLKWFELENTIARAMAIENPNRLSLGERWCFLRGSFVAGTCSEFDLMPQVVPHVKKKGCDLDLELLEDWSQSFRLTPPQKIMKPQDWPALYEVLEENRTIVSAEKSRVPICMYKLSDALLCFQAISNTKDLSLKKLKKEIAACPFLTLQENQICRVPGVEDVKITFVYLAPCHGVIKSSLLGANYDSDNDEKTINSVTKYHEYIHVAEGNSVLPLPHNVEVIVLLRPGIEVLLGKEGYAALVDPLQPREEIIEEPTESPALTVDDATAKLQALLERAQHIEGAEDFILEELQRLKNERDTQK